MRAAVYAIYGVLLLAAIVWNWFDMSSLSLIAMPLLLLIGTPIWIDAYRQGRKKWKKKDATR
jgi:hypothetical protein